MIWIGAEDSSTTQLETAGLWGGAEDALLSCGVERMILKQAAFPPFAGVLTILSFGSEPFPRSFHPVRIQYYWSQIRVVLASSSAWCLSYTRHSGSTGSMDSKAAVHPLQQYSARGLL